MPKTFLSLRIYIEGTGSLNAPHLKRENGRNLASLLVREIATPPVACIGMYVDVHGWFYQVDNVIWFQDVQTLNLDSSRGIVYNDQGPEDLTGRERCVAFFDGFVGEMISLGWVLRSDDASKIILNGS